MPELSPDALARFEKEVSDEFIERLLKYALCRIRTREWRGVWNGHLPRGKEAEDIVLEAVNDVLLGRRAWDAEAHPDLIHFMRSVVNSKVSHLLEGAENQSERLAPMIEEPDGPDYFDTIQHDGDLSADELTQLREDEARNDKMLMRLLDFLANEPLLQKIIECTIDGIEKRAEIANAAGVAEQEITNAKKRLDRRLADFRKANEHDNPFSTPH